MDKQIEEMRNDLSKAVIQDYGGVYFLETAKELYDLGYRKIPEGAVVLTEELDFYKGANRELTEKNAYLKQFADQFLADYQKAQKQVDELTDKLGKVLSGIKMDELLVAKGIEQAFKDTAKEIYSEIDDSDILVVETQEYGEIEVVSMERLKEIIKRKGVEVD